MAERLSDKNPCKSCGYRDDDICVDCEKHAKWKYEIIKKLAEYETAEEEGRLVVFDKCTDIIRKHMNDSWIPVEERLPEDTKSGFYNAVSVTMSNGSVTHGCYRNADGEWWVAMEDGKFKYTRSDEVIAWSPLPESYCPERSDNHDRE